MLASSCPDFDRVLVRVVADLVAERIFLRALFLFLYGLRGDSGPRVEVDERVAEFVSRVSVAGNPFRCVGVVGSSPWNSIFFDVPARVIGSRFVRAGADTAGMGVPKIASLLSSDSSVLKGGN